MAPKKRRSLRDLTREGRGLAEHFADDDPDSINADRSIIIIRAADLESALEDAIAKRMVPLSRKHYDNLFENELAPLKNSSSKIAVAHAFDIIGGKTHHDLTCIRHIRNAFAHARRPIWFQTPEVQDECSKLKCLARADEIESAYRPLDTARAKYLFATGQIIHALMEIAVPDLIGLVDRPTLPLD